MDELELMPRHITVENIQGSHHPGNRSHSRCWHPASWQRRAEDCAQNSPHCFGYDTCILEQFLSRNPPQLCPRKESLNITIPADKGRRRTLVNQLNAFVVGGNLLAILRKSDVIITSLSLQLSDHSRRLGCSDIRSFLDILQVYRPCIRIAPFDRTRLPSRF